MADKYVQVPGGVNRNNYANVDLIVEIAKREKVDAVWPGWGHASENPNLPGQLSQAGIRFVGPNKNVMAALGDKIAANILAQTAGVPSIPWSGDGVTAQLGADGSLPVEAFNKAVVRSEEECVRQAERIGFPVMLKASEGGGGKGIRLVHQANEIKAAFAQVCNEVPGSPVFVMQLCRNARHVEVQIMGDDHGQAVALNGRDCTTQRRFQKIFEEAPPVIVPTPTFKEMELAAQRLTRSIGYSGAGTVEFLYDTEKKSFSFLELNPRLQVEHPVTEAVTEINLPATQLQVAMGIPLHRIPQIRRFYGRDDDGSSNSSDKINFESESYRPLTKHCFAARITAENPEEGFKPSSGHLERIVFQSSPDTWGYFSVGAKGAIHEFADSQFGHIFATGKNREEARRSLMLALKRLEVRGEIRTPSEYLVNLLERPEMISNSIDTSWLDTIIAKNSGGSVPVESPDSFENEKNGPRQSKRTSLSDVIMGALLVRGKSAIEMKESSVIEALSRGQTHLKEAQSVDHVVVGVVYRDVRYDAMVTRTGPEQYKVEINGKSTEASLRSQADGALLSSWGSGSHRLIGVEEPMGLRLQVDGSTVFMPKVTDPSEMRSDVNGKVVRYLVTDGDHVRKGDPYVEVESMKMILSLRASEDGKISIDKSPGAVIAPGDLLGSLELADRSKVKSISSFDGQLVFDEPDGVIEQDPLSRLRLVMAGYDQAIDENVHRLLTSPIAKDKNNFTPITDQICDLFEDYLSVQEIFTSRNRDEVIAAQILSAMSKAPASPSSPNSASSPQREALASVLRLKISDRYTARRSQVIKLLLRAIKTFPVFYNHWVMPSRLTSALTRIASLTRVPVLDASRIGPPVKIDPCVSSVALDAQRVLEETQIESYEVRRERLRSELGRTSWDPQSVHELASSPRLSGGIDLLNDLMSDGTGSEGKGREVSEVSEKALEVYIRRVYRGYKIERLQVRRGLPGQSSELSETGESGESPLNCEWEFYQRDVGRQRAPVQRGLFIGLRDGSHLSRYSNNIINIVKRMGSNTDLSQFMRGGGGEGEQPMRAFNILHLGLDKVGEVPVGSPQESQLLSQLTSILTSPGMAGALKEGGVRRVSVLVQQAPHSPRYFNFIVGFNGEGREDPMRRDMNPSWPALLELNQLQQNFNLLSLPSANPNSSIYVGTPKASQLGTGISTSIKDKQIPQKSKTQQTVMVRSINHNTKVLRPTTDLNQSEDGQRSETSLNSTSLSGASSADQLSEMMTSLLDEAERARLSEVVDPSSSTRLFLHLIPRQPGVTSSEVVEAFKKMISLLRSSQGARLLRLNVEQIELKTHLDSDSPQSTLPESLQGQSGGYKVIRLVASSTSETGMWLDTTAFEEVPDAVTGEPLSFVPLHTVSDEETKQVFPLSDPHTGTLQSQTSPSKGVSFFSAPQGISLKRQAARRAGSTYVYDFLKLIETSLVKIWDSHILSGVGTGTTPIDLLTAKQLVMSDEDDDAPLEEVSDWRVGVNTIGMLGWVVKVKTPEYPTGRSLILIANDITHKGGSFGVAEDRFFFKASEVARRYGVPRVYISCNAGARIGMYDELKKVFKVGWNDPNDPKMGFNNLFLEKEAYRSLPLGSVNAHRANETELRKLNYGPLESQLKNKDDNNRNEKYIIDDIIGDDKEDIGVENLKGSGLIAGETSRAYEKTFTLSYVSGRSVGIGAYLVRLGQRVIQMANSPLVLTGYQALNKLLGKEVYASQDQLGGPQIMYANGVSHLVVSNDQQGMDEMLKWLSYVPKTVTSVSPFTPTKDPVDRDVTFTPTKTPYDPRLMFTGTTGPNGEALSGVFDQGSFTEYMGGWAKGVVVGRARLGGIPVGVIGAETRATEARIPADPANPAAREVINSQAGQVWYPDSAFKTAQAIKDFNTGERLPLMIFANWRGFSGGTRDMFEEVLKFGAMIVDALRTYKQPVFVYIPPEGELRGGAWVVLDPSINSAMMEMVADKKSRGGILEPAGMCEIKFRQAEQLETMHRLDIKLRELDATIEKAISANDEGQVTRLRGQIKQREEALTPVYLQLAQGYADLHDRSGRMVAKGVVRDSIDFKDARRYFYGRLKRRLAEDEIKIKLHQIDTTKRWDFLGQKLTQSVPRFIDPTDDQAVAEFLNSNEGREMAKKIGEDLNLASAPAKVAALLEGIPVEHRQQVLSEGYEKAQAKE
eukprot:GHVN01091171.1.p1 GENE.GHVN01091171.1~~GHVN01091171.1.p1  ORF type:complete len:2264 (-),score=531.53 GHVN01091171.1:305-6862(-)